ncbi:MAG: FxsA family protein [Pseudomonadota bacterium]
MPFAFVFLLLIFLEIAGFVAMANAVGLLGVFALVILGMLAGGLIIRTIGVASVVRMQERAERGETVGQELGGLVLGFLGGVFLIIPGFLTDLIGLLLLIKPIQTLVWPRYGRQMTNRMPPMDGRWQSPGRPQRPQADKTVVIDAEATNEERPAAGRPNGNPWAS